jgi:arabinan endo-1,5-alpha-L-arabinosidase
MVKEGDLYHIYTTGDGIWNMSADNPEFLSWRAEPVVFPIGTWPEWINDYVPGFGGSFWAPEIIFMNGKWHLYYSCSSWGSQRSAIGVVTTASLTDPDWQDQGMVVHTDNTWNVNAIDPDIFRDREGKIWLVFGSYWDGIVITEIDSTTGKAINQDNLYPAANGDPEAGNVISHGDYYYLFFNRGACCRGVHSTYRMLMGRSESPTGPYLDKDSVPTHSGGGTVFLHSDGRFIGPGHFGYGEGKLTYHYYDGAQQGAAKLGIAELSWDEEGWPVAEYSRSLEIADGRYMFHNVNSGKVLELEGADTTAGSNVVQGTEQGAIHQLWDVKNSEKGYFTLSPALAPGKVLEVENCSGSNGANVQIGNLTGKDCQLWYGAFIGSGEYVIMSAHSYQTLEVVNAYTYDQANVQQWPYNEHETQRWKLSEATGIIYTGTGNNHQHLVYPNPSHATVTIDLSTLEDQGEIRMVICSMEGRTVYRENLYQVPEYRVSLPPGIYVLHLDAGNNRFTEKLTVQ